MENKLESHSIVNNIWHDFWYVVLELFTTISFSFCLNTVSLSQHIRHTKRSSCNLQHMSCCQLKAELPRLVYTGDTRVTGSNMAATHLLKPVSLKTSKLLNQFSWERTLISRICIDKLWYFLTLQVLYIHLAHCSLLVIWDLNCQSYLDEMKRFVGNDLEMF